MLAALTIGVGPTPARAQEPKSERPRIGLVLGGGGARGGAHVGVLRILEELRIPIDVIAGTSMGAVIGGAYASGMTVDEIEKLMVSLDWDELFRSAPPRQDVAFRRKQDTRAFPDDLEVGFDGHGFRLPSRLIGGHGLNFLLRTVTLPVSEVWDFDRLPIPFRSVATDVATGEPVVLDHGDLAKAMLASMAVPGAFEPIEIDGRLLVDGGLVRNLPIDVARAMGADVVIAVDVGDPLEDQEALTSALGVAAQMIVIMMVTNSRAQEESLGPDDVYLRPELGEITMASFQEIAQTISPGRAAALDAGALLERYAVSEAEYAPYAARTLPRQQRIRVDFVQIDNNTGLSDRVLANLLDLSPGDDVTLDELRHSLTLFQGAGDFDKVDFELLRRGDLIGLRVVPIEKSWGPGLFRFGLFVRDNFNTDGAFDLVTRFTLTRLNQRGGELRAELQLGKNRGLSGEWYQPLDNRLAIFGSLRGAIGTELDVLYTDQVAVAEYQTDRAGLWLLAGSRLGLWGQVRAGLQREWIKSNAKVGDPDLPVYDTNQTALVGDFLIDTQDNAQFPAHGFTADVSLQHAAQFLGGSVAFDRLRVSFKPAFTRGRNTLLFVTEANTSFGTNLPQYDQFNLGGLFRLSGLNHKELRGDYSGLVSALFFRAVGRPRGLAAIGGFRLGFSIETGNVWDTAEEIGVSDLRLAGGLFAGMETLIGPIYTGFGMADQGATSWYFFLGRVF